MSAARRLLLVLAALALGWSLGAAASVARMSRAEYAVAKCQQRCFLRTLAHFQFRRRIDSAESTAACRASPDCHMCSDYCHVLDVAAPALALAMCSDELYCSKGCRTACDHFRVRPRPASRPEPGNNS